MRSLNCIILLACLSFTAFAQSPFSLLQDGNSKDKGEVYAKVLPGKLFSFPRDHGAHPDYRIEWWYLNANLKDKLGRHWGLQWTLFRHALSPQPQPKPELKGWRSNQIWMAHVAISTPDGHFHQQRFARGGIGQAGVSQSNKPPYFNAWMDDWEWRSEGEALFPASLKFNLDGFDVVLKLEESGELVKNGGQGYSQKSAEGTASYYYSQPHITVQAKVTDASGEHQLSGVAWLDREWSSQALAGDQQGWDWFSLHLDDGSKLMIYQLRGVGDEVWMSGNWVHGDGVSQVLTADDIQLSVTGREQIQIGEGDEEKYAELPMFWKLNLPGLKRSFSISALYKQQWMLAQFPYWEGVVLVHEAEKKAGVGYMELTGYQ